MLYNVYKGGPFLAIILDNVVLRRTVCVVELFMLMCYSVQHNIFPLYYTRNTKFYVIKVNRSNIK